ncbi:T9SS type A sorting domain-containing protein [Spirosoma utsteinense]|uniref:T9SS type A sorting domain-containing protein n=1 Tax=Spirosoma utsteinense TaxID=2585773 RepID=A0ABR6W6I8_9BACT|nr:T9SS type A sorting domain-containing protein [Spirosoma utsteinense]MBC3785410.1 hypothetical protein [Spirosoma utsteinense]MBC3791562.1 hypothetical protein [Spirosoma utsteinense]
MKGRNVYAYFFVWLFISGVCANAYSQTITTNSVAPATICPGKTVTVTFSTTGTFNAGNMFTAQLSDATGTFGASPTIIGSMSGVIAGLITATIPNDTPEGNSYRVRVVSSAPARTGSSSAQVLTVATTVAPGVTPPAPYCAGDTPAGLIATPSAGGTLNWYGTSATGGTATPVAPTPTSSGTYYVSQTVNGCEGPRASITVTVKAKPAKPGTSPVSYCAGQTASSLSATPSAGGTLNWYGTNATGGTATPVAPTPTSSGTYYVSQTVNGCESDRASLVVTISAIPAAPTATDPPPFCKGASATDLTANGQNLLWYGTNMTGGTGDRKAPQPGTTNVGTTNYYVSQTINGCESPRKSIAVVVKDTPAAPAFTPAPTYCQGQTATALVATPSTGATLNWYGTSATGGTSSPSAPTPNTLQAETVMYYVSQTLDGCESSRAAISVVTRPTPAAPQTSALALCQNRPPTTLSATPSANGTLNWYGTSASGGTASATAPVPPTEVPGTQTYYVSQTVNGCESPRASLVVTINTVPVAPTATPPNAYCEGSTAVALVATGTGLRWYGTSATGGTGTSGATVPATTTVGTTNYYVTQTVAGCESDRTAIPVRVKDTPDRPVTAAIDFCQNTPAPTLTATTVTSATTSWFGTNATGGTASATPPTPAISTVGTTTYYVSQTLDGCESPRASLSVRVKETPGAPGVSRISFCNNSSAQPLTASGSNIKWFDATGSPLSNAPTPATNSVGDQTFKASQTSNEGCEGPKADLVVTIKPLPGSPSVANLNFCQAQTDQPGQNISALSAGGQNLRWYNTNGSALQSAPIPSISQTGVQTYQVSQTVDNCEGSRATLQVTVNTTAAPVVAKPLVAYCINDKATPLQATIESGATARWVDPYNRLSNEAPTPSTINTNIDPAGDPFFVYQIGSNGCYSARSTIRVVVNTTPTLSLAALRTNVNLGVRVPLKLTFTGSAPYSYTITGGYTGTSLASDTTISVLPRGNTTYQVLAVTNGCGIGLPGNPATAEVTVRIPTVTTGSVTSSTLCAGTSLTVPFSTTGEFNPGNLFRFELISLADTTKKYAVAATATASPVTATLPLTIPSGRYTVRVNALNPEIGVTGTSSPTQLTIRSLPAATLTGTQTIFEGTPANLTIAFGGDGPWTVAYADSIRSYSTTTTVSPYVAEVRPSRTTTYRLTTVSNNCGTGPLSGTATVMVAPLLSVEDNSLDPLVTAYPVPTSSILTVELDLPLTRDPAQLSLINMQGQSVVQHTTRNRRTELDLSTQANGFYILRIQVGDRYTMRKVVKQ